MKRFIRLTTGYMMAVALTAIVGIISIPVVVASVGLDAWSQVAVVQAAGLILGTTVAFGWPVVGPGEIAKASTAGRAAILGASVRLRFALLIPAIVILLSYVGVVYGSNSHLLALIFAGMVPLFAALSSPWFFVGESDSRGYFVFDIIPRVSGSILGVVLIGVNGELALFTGSQLVGQGLCVALSYVILRLRYPPVGRTSSLWATFKAGLAGFTTSITANLYQNAPIIFISLLAPSQLAVFAIADRVYRIALVALAPGTQVAQGYVAGMGMGAVFDDRVRRAMWVTTAIAVTSGISFALFAPLVGGLLSVGEGSISLTLACLLGAALGAVFLSSVVGRACLVPLGRSRGLAMATVAGALIGVVATFLGVTQWGAAGAGMGMLAGELTVLLVCIMTLRKALAFRADGSSGGMFRE
jgi:O-antigen/teichoic acid export membrane protein